VLDPVQLLAQGPHFFRPIIVYKSLLWASLACLNWLPNRGGWVRHAHCGNKDTASMRLARPVDKSALSEQIPFLCDLIDLRDI